MRSYLAVLVVLVAAITVQAEIIPLVNGDFEDTTAMYPTDRPLGWQSNMTFGVGSIAVEDGQACILNMNVNSQVLNQKVQYSLQSGDTYQLSFDLNNGAESIRAWTAVHAQLWAVHPSLGTAYFLGSTTITPSDFASSAKQWDSFSFDYELDGYTNYWPLVQFQVVGGYQVYLDNVVLQTIPEPMTISLLCVGLLAVIRRRK